MPYGSTWLLDMFILTAITDTVVDRYGWTVEAFIAGLVIFCGVQFLLSLGMAKPKSEQVRKI